MMYLFFFKDCSQTRKRSALCFHPLLLEQTASIQNRAWNWRGRIRKSHFLWAFFPKRAELTRGLVLVNWLQVPLQNDCRQRQSAQECFEIDSHGAFTLERLDSAKCSHELRIKPAKQLYLGGREIALLPSAHNCNPANESLAFPKKQTKTVRTFLRRNVAA